MFINNMIDTSMSYKDTNGTKYTENDKVSGFEDNPYDRYTGNTLPTTANYYHQIYQTYTEYANEEDRQADDLANRANWAAGIVGYNDGGAYLSELSNQHRRQANSYRSTAQSYYKMYYDIVNTYIPNCNSLKLKAKNIASSIFGNEQYGLKIKNIYTVYQTIFDSAKQIAHRLEKLLSAKL